MDRRRQPRDELGLAASGGAPRAEPSARSVAEPVREDRAEHRDADRAADLPEQRRARGGDAELLVRDGVLDREHEHLHHHAEPEAEHDHVERGLPGRHGDAEPESRHIATVITAVPTIGNGL